MRSRFSVEWLSQSSENNGSAPAGPWPSTNQTDLCASSTLPESLPGFYCSKREAGTKPEERPHGSAVPQCPEATSHSLAQVYGSPQETSFRGSLEEVGEQTGGSESKGGSPLSPAALQDSSIASTGTGRRPRTAFTTEQINQLEKAFKRNVYLGTHDKAELCKKLNLSDKQIRNWFQNRRMKLKRTYQDTLTHSGRAKLTPQLVHFPDLQPFRPSPYPTYYPVQKTQILYQPPSGLHYSTSPAVDAMSALPVDPLCHFGCIPNLAVTPGDAPLVSPYHPYYRCY
ncbi:ventrally expressed dharma/bozozok antagonist [Scleropages formosus]|uniref:Ventrally expressed dharma/bozozok antagonist n=1 Tax=Scleropages formosus TaxID=113540 RepID=A0A8C9RQL3_SCLFO|nr:transcription factor LBX2-like [Scleropages formosus]